MVNINLSPCSWFAPKKCLTAPGSVKHTVIRTKDLELAKLALNTLENECSCIKTIIENALKTGTVKYQELLGCLQSRGLTDADQFEDIEILIKDMDFEILR